MKHLKAKLMTSIVMLLIAAIAMSTASYAWFTISTNPEITGISGTLVTNDNLEIKDSTDSTSWKDTEYGNIVECDVSDGGILRPAKFASGAWTAPLYDVDGRVKTANGVTIDEDASGILKGSDKLTYGYWFDVSVRSNMTDSTLKLVDATKRSSNGKTGGGSTVTCADNEFVQKHVCVAFKLGTGSIVSAVNDGDGTLSCAEIGTLVKDTETNLRIYVYLDGETITNAAASITNTSTVYKADLNLQFGNTATTSMDATSGS